LLAVHPAPAVLPEIDLGSRRSGRRGGFRRLPEGGLRRGGPPRGKPPGGRGEGTKRKGAPPRSRQGEVGMTPGQPRVVPSTLFPRGFVSRAGIGHSGSHRGGAAARQERLVGAGLEQRRTWGGGAHFFFFGTDRHRPVRTTNDVRAGAQGGGPRAFTINGVDAGTDRRVDPPALAFFFSRGRRGARGPKCRDRGHGLDSIVAARPACSTRGARA